MNKPNYIWYVKHHIMGRVVICELWLGDTIEYVVMGLWPWERRQAPTLLLTQMAKDSSKAMFTLQINAVIKSAHEVSNG